MAYSEFTLEDVNRRLGLLVKFDSGHFASVPPVAVSPWLNETLKKSAPLGVAIGTEKAKSELMVAPVLLEARDRAQGQVSLFSGVDFNVDAVLGLKGTVDFLMSLSAEQYSIDSPVVAIVEAKRDDFAVGLGQCVAEMYAARLFNQQHKTEIEIIYGVVTTGMGWMFCRLIGNEVFHDTDEYSLQNVDQIVGVLVSMLKSQA